MVGALLATAMHVAAAQPSERSAAATRATALDGARTMTLHGPRAAALAQLTAQAVQPLEELGAEPRPPAPDPETPPSAAAEPDREAPASSTEEGGGLRLDLDLDLDTPIEPRADTPVQPPETVTEGSVPPTPAPTETPVPPVAEPPPAPTESPAPPVEEPPPAPTETPAPPVAEPPPAPTETPAPPASGPAPAVDSTPDAGGGQPGIVRVQPPPRAGLPIWVYLLGAALLLAVLVVAVVLVLRRRRGAPGPVAPTRASAPRTPAPAPAAPAAAARATAAPPAPIPERPAPAPVPAGARPLAVLRDLSGTTDQAEHPIGAAVVQIGRAESELDGVQSVVVQKKTVGRRHAVIEFRNHTYWLVDQGSLNGTYVNGDRVAGEVALRPGARISLESAEFEFTMPGMDMNATMVASSVDEFSETLVAPSIAGAPAPGRQTRSAADQGVDARDDTARPAEKEAIAAATAAGTVDFDVLGDADPEPTGKDPGRRG